jgi:hypothetical protein
MKQRITKIGPLQLGYILAVLSGLSSLILFPFLLLAPEDGNGILYALAVPVLYSALGFISGLIIAFIYNLIAKWIGGIVIETEEV